MLLLSVSISTLKELTSGQHKTLQYLKLRGLNGTLLVFNYSRHSSFVNSSFSSLIECIETMAQQPEPQKAATEPFILKLPHPYLTAYAVTSNNAPNQPKSYQIKLSEKHAKDNGLTPPALLHNESISFSDATVFPNDQLPPKGDNSSWARTRRSPAVNISWTGDRPSVPQIWLVAYALVSLHPLVEQLRIIFDGKNAEALLSELYLTGLFAPHPQGSNTSSPHDGCILLRGCFWQGAASPFGARPVWAPHLDASNKPITAEYPAFPFQNAPTTQFPALPRHTQHPVRRPKPAPGSIIYSRWIPHLQEHFTMVALDYTNDEHLKLFNVWQNDPRVAAGWNETGTLDQHREYLRKLHEDPHVLTMFAAFDNILFAYFEVYWAMVRSPPLPQSYTISTVSLTATNRKITWVPTTWPRPTTVAATRWLVTSGSEVRTAFPRGGQASCTTCSWTSHAHGTSWASPRLRAALCLRMTSRTASTLRSCWIYPTRGVR